MFVHRGNTIAALVHREGWVKGAELGLEDGATLAGVLTLCPKLEMIGVDIWDHARNEMDFYVPWDHSENERKARAAVEHFYGKYTVEPTDSVWWVEIT